MAWAQNDMERNGYQRAGPAATRTTGATARSHASSDSKPGGSGRGASRWGTIKKDLQQEQPRSVTARSKTRRKRDTLAYHSWASLERQERALVDSKLTQRDRLTYSQAYVRAQARQVHTGSRTAPGTPR